MSAVAFVYGPNLVSAWAGPFMGMGTLPGSAWRPYQAASVVTPPFAEYVSGHSAFSAAAATVLQKFTQSDSFGASVTIPVGASRVEPGMVPAGPVTLSGSTFSAAADEAGISRSDSGIHFIDGELEGRRVRRRIGLMTTAADGGRRISEGRTAMRSDLFFGDVTDQTASPSAQWHSTRVDGLTWS